MEIKVKGMMCEHCEAKVNKALTELGCTNVKADHNNDLVTLDFDESKISLKDIKKCIKKIGFKA